MLSYCFAITVMFMNTLCAPYCGTGNCGLQNQLEDSKQNNPPCATNAANKDATGVSSSPLSLSAGVSPEVPARRRNKCCPYEFDSKLCQVVNDRLLCGFNRNIGRPPNDDVPEGVGGGCRIRGGRLECGYEEGPFNNIRRPPAWSNSQDPSPDQNDDDNNNNDDDNDDQPDDDEEEQKIPNKVKLKKKKTAAAAPVSRCVEIKERIVCKDW